VAEPAPVRARRGNSHAVLAIGVGAVVVIGVVVFLLRGRPSPPAAGPALSGAALLPGAQPAAPVPRDPSTAGPGAPGSAATAPGSATAAPGALEAKDEGKPESKKQGAPSARRRRSSREAIDSLNVPPAGGGEAPAIAPRAKAGVGTPAELKNPFAPSVP
jgi:hypothetical protein